MNNSTKNPTENQVHGHEVMRMMLESKTPFTKATLKAAIIERFGEDQQFYTCSADSLSAEELIDFLEGKSKFTEQSGGGFQTSEDVICSD